jgi:hypothetical protein
MKKTFAKGFVTAAVLAMAIIAAGVSAQAQSLQYKLTVDIPFEFSVSNEKLPAGKYWVSRAQESSGDTVVQIKSVEGHAVANRFSIPIVTFKTKKRGELVFHRYGEQYFLSEIWPVGGGTGRAFLKTHAERELQRSARDNGVAAVKATKPEIVTVVALAQR